MKKAILEVWTALLVRGGAGIHTLDDLRGATVSLVDPASTSGGIVPRVAVQRMTGMMPEAWFSRVSYAGSHDLVIEAVLHGRVTAAFVSNNRVDEAIHRGLAKADALRVLWRSDPIPYAPFVYQADLCPSVKAAIHRVFFERSAELRPFFDWRSGAGFGPVSDSDYAHLRQNLNVSQ